MKDFEILFVDDKRETLSLVDEYLSYHGYSVTIVDSGLKAFELIKERHFDIVLTDLRMPGFSGLELLTAITLTSISNSLVSPTGLTFFS